MASERETMSVHLMQRLRQAQSRFDHLDDLFRNDPEACERDCLYLAGLIEDARQMLQECDNIQAEAERHELYLLLLDTRELRGEVSNLYHLLLKIHEQAVVLTDPHIVKGAVITIRGIEVPFDINREVFSPASPYGRNSFMARPPVEDGVYELVATRARICGRCAEAIEPRQKSVCGGCRHTRYCSKACQIAHRPMHKGVCREMQAAREKA